MILKIELQTIKTGDLGLSSGTSFLAKGIQLFTKCKYNHAFVFWWNYDELFVIEADRRGGGNGAGIITTPFADYIKSKKPVLIKRPTFEINGSELGKFMLSKVGRINYSKWNLIVAQPLYQLFGFWIGTSKKNAERMVCSAWCGYVYNNFYPEKFKHWSRLDPEDLFNDNVDFKSIYLIENDEIKSV